jgi:CBS domain-containing protein
MAISVANICQRDVDVIGPDESVAKAADRMRQRTVGSLIVVDAAKRPVGIITDRDLVIRALADARDADATPVSEVMTPDIITTTVDTSINSALRLMRDGPFRRLPIVDKKGVLVGLVTADDLLILLGRDFGELASLIELETPATAASYRPAALSSK